MRLLFVLLAFLATFATENAAAQQSTAIPKFGASLFSRENELLEPDQAFGLTITPRDSTSLQAEFIPATGYYLYRHRISFSVEQPDGVKVVGVDLPPGESKNDAAFGETRVFHQPFSAVINIKRDAKETAAVKIKATYQGCSERGICYPPINKIFDVKLTAGASEPSGSVPHNKTETGIAGALASGSFWVVIGVFFGAGLLLAFTPCVLPMIPILSGIIAGHGQSVTRTRGLLLSLSYVLGMAITYAAAGVAAGLTGSLLSTALQNAWVLGGFALIFVLLALSMFGLYDLRMPAIIQGRADSLSHRLSGGKVFAVFGMGALSALIVSPCVTAPLAGALLYIGQTGDVKQGGIALFAMALGMGTPLLAIGVSAGALLPKAGSWMDSVKRFFGVLLLAVAIWLISPVISMVLQMLLWASLLIISASFLRAIDPLPADTGGLPRLAKGVGLMALVSGIAILVGALAGGRDLLQPLAVLRGGAPAVLDADLGFEKIRTVSELEARLQQADRPVMLDFYADWCISCKEMEELTYRDARVTDRLQEMLLLKVDVTENTAEDQALLKRFGLVGPPSVIFFDANGKEIRNLRVTGYQPADAFLRAVDQALDPGISADKTTITSLVSSPST